MIRRSDIVRAVAWWPLYIAGVLAIGLALVRQARKTRTMKTARTLSTCTASLGTRLKRKNHANARHTQPHRHSVDNRAGAGLLSPWAL